MERDIDLLIERYWDDDLTLEELEELNQLLLDDEELSARFAQALQMKGKIASVLHRDTDCHRLADQIAAAIGGDASGQTARTGRPRKTITPMIWLAAAAGIALCLGLLVVWSPWRKPAAAEPVQVARLESVEGDITVLRQGLSKSIMTPSPIYLSDTILTGSNGKVNAVYPDGTTVTIKSGSELSVLSKPGDGIKLSLNQGGLRADVRPQPAGRPMRIETPRAIVTVLGTVFDLTASSAQTRLDVSKGLVELKRRDDTKTVEVPAGQYGVVSEADLVALPVAGKPGPDDVRYGLIKAPSGKPTPAYSLFGNNMVIDMAKVRTDKINILVRVPSREIRSAMFQCDGPVRYLLKTKKKEGPPRTKLIWRKQRSKPFTVFGDDHGAFYEWEPVNGRHTITSRFYKTPDCSGPPHWEHIISFTVINAKK